MPLKRLAGLKLPLLDDVRAPVREASRLVVAAISAAIGLGVVELLEPLLSRPYFFPGFFAVIFPAILAGTRHGVLATFLFGAGYAYLYLDPRGSFAVKDGTQALALAAYTLTSCFVAAVCGVVRATYTQLREQHQLLERIHRQREDLLRALTHDVRSPLSAISMAASLLATSDPAAGRRVAVIQKSVATIDSMLRDLVEVVALESGTVKLEREAIDLEAMLSRLKDGLAGTLPVERVHLAVATEGPAVHADPRRFERVLVNLISNALKYSPGDVTVRAAPQGDEVIVAVRDEGPGVPPDELPHLFEKYFRANAALSQQGLGLGLYISRLLVEAHGGRIWAESAPGKGSTFSVALPATHPVRAPRAVGS
jgi:signal transduction histidine kinase